MSDELTSTKIVLVQSYLRLNGFRNLKAHQEDDGDVRFVMTFDGEPYRLQITTDWLEAVPLKSIESRLNRLDFVAFLLRHRSACIEMLITGGERIVPLASPD